ncbi:GFA family protein [Rhizobium laguerreae]|uniref:GFA family protein n=1 Tax=Rhizobium laguerreae TaxID=1076926 RepID=UPI001C929FFB|nr:GFA family protein [Rhizobium laguerreae]MBY3088616.1 GFA family protein [Rhizobium laguerreae]MBY3150544.1 GFA family protein [Rhizobium laguerreae]
MVRRASCSCGQLAATAEGEALVVSVCHCRSCQSRTGSAFGIAAFFKAVDVELSGASKTFRRLGDSGKNIEFHFCPTCGSTVFWKPEFRPGLVAIALGCFEEAHSFWPTKSVYNSFSHEWVNLNLADTT